MSDTAHVKTIIENVPPEVKAEIARRVELSESNMNDLVVSILARSFSVPFEPSGRRSPFVGTSDRITLRLPEPLRRAIKGRAGEQGTTLRDEVVQALIREFANPVVRAPRERAAA